MRRFLRLAAVVLAGLTLCFLTACAGEQADSGATAEATEKATTGAIAEATEKATAEAIAEATEKATAEAIAEATEKATTEVTLEAEEAAEAAEGTEPGADDAATDADFDTGSLSLTVLYADASEQTVTIQLTNDGTRDLTVTGWTIDQAELSGSSEPTGMYEALADVPAGERLEVTLTPARYGLSWTGFTEEEHTITAAAEVVGRGAATLETVWEPEMLYRIEAASKPECSWDQSEGTEASEHLRAYYSWDGDETGLNMPDCWGGVYMDEGVLTVCLAVTENAALWSWAEEIYAACGTRNVALQAVTYTWNELLAANDALNAAVEAGAVLAYSWGVSVKTNSVDVTLSSEAEAIAAETLLADYPCIQWDWAEAEPTHSEYGDTPEAGDVLLETDAESYAVGAAAICCTLTNQSGEDICYIGEDVTLEAYLDGDWYTLDDRPGVAFSASLPVLDAGESCGVNVNLELINYRFGEGRYRIVLYWEPYRSYTGAFTNACFAEFTVGSD